jgi:hypothetical protein
VTLTGGLRPRGLPSAARVGSGLALAAASDVAGSTSLEAEKKLVMVVEVVVMMVVEVVVM